MSNKKNNFIPVVFFGHGSPMNAIEDNEFSQNWELYGKKLPTIKGILSISAHWETDGVSITSMNKPKTIHDFYGFPQELFNLEYPASGSPDLVKRVIDLVPHGMMKKDYDWGLDHGTWSVLHRLKPKADIPVVQLSLNRNFTPQEHFVFARHLLPLRQEGILIMGSGNVDHNLRLMQQESAILPWAVDFDKLIQKSVQNKNYQVIVNYRDLPNYQLSIPTNEHFLPLIYILALVSPDDRLSIFNSKVTHGSLSMTSYWFENS